MNTEDLAQVLSQMHIDHASLLTRVAASLSTGGEVGVLLWLYQRDRDTYAVDIVEHFALTPGRVANIVKRMEQRGYILRLQNTEDLRKARILLTETGSEHARQLYRDMNDGHVRMLNALGTEDAEHVVRILRRVIDLMDDGVELHAP